MLAGQFDIKRFVFKISIEIPKTVKIKPIMTHFIRPPLSSERKLGKKSGNIANVNRDIPIDPRSTAKLISPRK
jgi:hypothetical protein